MNEERIRQLEDLGFVWALRGQEGSRRDDSMLHDSVAALQNAPLVPVEAIVPVVPIVHHPEHPPHNPEDILEEPSVMAAYQVHEL